MRMPNGTIQMFIVGAIVAAGVVFGQRVMTRVPFP